MIGISTRTIYGLAAMYELSKHSDDKPLKIKDIAKNANIPQNFLEQILLELKKSGLLVSTKGAHGGYRLAKPAKEIMICDIIRVLENDYFVNGCRTDNPVLKLFWEDLQKKIETTMAIPLTKLHDYQQKLDESYTYYI